MLLAGTALAALVLVRERSLEEAAAAPTRHVPLLVRHPEARRPEAPHIDLRRWHRVYRFASRYRISPDLAGTIHDAAVAEGIEPELAFRVVDVESEFNPRAISPVGAVGLTQLMPATARHFVPGVTRKQLYDPHLNARVGFRYLRGLIKEYKSVRLALLVYNRGPVAVQAALDSGQDPANGYERVVMGSYRGRGLLD
ncbi:transglycosylase SLT domain-containing protein [Roseisolibacter sp. H3M3-2]|uniref:lytic transglycosylase domain-containing protein n=1 Tax=Roseisolibacter sp. H3M3-2 TaxID=3031323 RepID=UPI0023DA742E|nr:transglycosylase SLT domain-containing protein [Roseisolibacter sp. H3M3-2]MDF1502093.1 transglycosylase SLT domain-containing protein [Roseisolibacter sp. H3M3-2]